MKLTQTRAALVACFLGLGAADSAFAQFPGDVFFEDPATTVIEGETIDLDVLFFGGPEISGVVGFDVIFDPAEVELVAVSAPVSPAADTLFTFPGVGRDRVVVVNDDSLVQPFGVSSVTTLTVRPLVPAGQSISLVLEARGAIAASGIPFAQSTGFGAQVSVVSGLTSRPTSSGHLFANALATSVTTNTSVAIAPHTVPHPVDASPVPVRSLGSSYLWISPRRLGRGAWVPYRQKIDTVDPTAPTD